jgi:hypothetical protein
VHENNLTLNNHYTMSKTIKNKLRYDSKNVTADATFTTLELTGYAKLVDFYNNGETLATIHLPGEPEGAAGTLCPAGSFVTVAADDETGIDLSGISVEFATGEGALNITIEYQNLI